MTDLGDNLNLKPVVDAPTKGKRMGHLGFQPTRRIMLDEDANIPPTGLFVSVNGYGYLLKVGVPIDAPLPVIETLNNAVVNMPLVDPDTLQYKGSRERRRFSFRYLDDKAA